MTLHVIIAGAGVGGLCLAQGLRRHGISVAVYERDSSTQSRHQGYRLRIDEHGRTALAECLPAELNDLAHATANQMYMPRGTSYDHQLNPLGSWRPAAPLDPARAAIVVNRRTLREILLAGLDDVVHFGQTVTGYTEHDDHVSVRFADGSEAAGDVLVAADGINSVVRGQLLPHTEVLDTGLRAIYGHLPLTDEVREWVPAELLGGSRPVLGPERTTLALGVFQPVRSPEQAAADLAPYAKLHPVPAYVKWTLVAPIGSYPVAEQELFTATPERLHAIAGRLVGAWHPTVRRLVAESVVADTFALSIRSTLPSGEWTPGRVTVLGDAIHATTPVGGTGANTALRDAALLASRIARVEGGRGDLLAAITSFECDMRQYGYQAVRDSLSGAATIFQTADLAQKGSPA
ncbi:NAD(P)/FAD-dependent oxidoreductase [Actinoplanes sp. TFC3]|uniref:FAD-dependent oxidoreductase n=1 Tax=Actinoplanes sp. TFC3 TaxID=1710355 RepID=UPI00082ED53B|nr:NAD(P)/FAD-dependent oxidoreductase [Actinoplanes sp. TFC3]